MNRLPNAIWLPLLLLLFRVVQAQPYRLIKPEATYLFGHENLAIGRTQFDHAILLDSSLTVGTDTLRFNYRIAEHIGPGACLYSYSDTSWLGNYFIEQPGNKFIFLNRHQDSIFFHADSLSNWRLMQLPSGGEIRAEYLGTQGTFVNGGVPDSIRILKLQAYSNLSQPMAHGMNGKMFHVGKAHGLVQAVSFWEFPDTVAGHSAILSLEDNAHVNHADLWDLQPGDSLHVYELKRNVQEEVQTFWEYVVQSRSTNATQDSLFIQMSSRYIRHYWDWSNPVVITSQTGSIQHKIRISPQDQPWDQLPYACPDVMGAQLADPHTTAALYRTADYNGRMVKTHYQAIWPGVYEFDTLNQCFPEPGSQGFLPVKLFGVEGLGADYYRDTFPSSISALERYPVWFRKGGESWGTPWDFDGLLSSRDGRTEGNIRIYPQPLEIEAWIETAAGMADAKLEIWDLQGRRVKVIVLDPSGRTLLKREEFPAGGLFAWRVMRADGEVAGLGKILVSD